MKQHVHYFYEASERIKSFRLLPGRVFIFPY